MLLGWQPAQSIDVCEACQAPVTPLFRHPLVLSPVCPARVLCTVQVELKHFVASDTVVPAKMHEQVMHRDGPAADGEAFAYPIPPECDWALECFVHKLLAKGMHYLTYRVACEGPIVTSPQRTRESRVRVPAFSSRAKSLQKVRKRI
jgi:hypothetical protein